MSGDAGRIRLYLADIRPLYDPVLARRVYGRLDDARQRKADLCRKPAARAASLAAGFLARYALEENGYGGYPIRYEAGGRPVVQAGGREIFLSLSHSGDYAACALSGRPVGVDLQKRQPVRAGVLRHFYPPKRAALFLERYEAGASGVLEGEALDRFLREWTVKESYMKMTGQGMKLGFSEILADMEKRTASLENGEGRTAVFREYRAPDGYFLSACTEVWN